MAKKRHLNILPPNEVQFKDGDRDSAYYSRRSGKRNKKALPIVIAPDGLLFAPAQLDWRLRNEFFAAIYVVSGNNVEGSISRFVPSVKRSAKDGESGIGDRVADVDSGHIHSTSSRLYYVDGNNPGQTGFPAFMAALIDDYTIRDIDVSPAQDVGRLRSGSSASLLEDSQLWDIPGGTDSVTILFNISGFEFDETTRSPGRSVPPAGYSALRHEVQAVRLTLRFTIQLIGPNTVSIQEIPILLIRDSRGRWKGSFSTNVTLETHTADRSITGIRFDVPQYKLEVKSRAVGSVDDGVFEIARDFSNLDNFDETVYHVFYPSAAAGSLRNVFIQSLTRYTEVDTVFDVGGVTGRAFGDYVRGIRTPVYVYLLVTENDTEEEESLLEELLLDVKSYEGMDVVNCIDQVFIQSNLTAYSWKRFLFDLIGNNETRTKFLSIISERLAAPTIPSSDITLFPTTWNGLIDSRKSVHDLLKNILMPFRMEPMLVEGVFQTRNLDPRLNENGPVPLINEALFGVDDIIKDSIRVERIHEHDDKNGSVTITYFDDREQESRSVEIFVDDRGNPVYDSADRVSMSANRSPDSQQIKLTGIRNEEHVRNLALFHARRNRLHTHNLTFQTPYIGYTVVPGDIIQVVLNVIPQELWIVDGVKVNYDDRLVTITARNYNNRVWQN